MHWVSKEVIEVMSQHELTLNEANQEQTTTKNRKSVFYGFFCIQYVLSETLYAVKWTSKICFASILNPSNFDSFLF